MSPQREEMLKGILRQVYQEKEKIEVADVAPEDIMRRIRRLGTLQPSPSFLEMFQSFVWRLAPIVCLLILVLTAVSLAVDFASGHDVFQVLMNGREELTLAQLFEG
jgi:hypothetical protein